MGKWFDLYECCQKKFLIKVEDSLNHKDYLKYERLRAEIWGDPFDNLPCSRNMLNENYFDRGGVLFIGAYALDESGQLIDDYNQFAGFSYGFIGVKDYNLGFESCKNLRFYSQYTGVKKDFHNFGLAIAIKNLQKRVVLDLFKISEVICSCDPLTGVNAARNIGHFGMTVLEYKESMYSDFLGHLNRSDIPSDRLLLSWDLTIDRPQSQLKGDTVFNIKYCILNTNIKQIQGKSGPLLLNYVIDLNLDIKGDRLFLEIPNDYYTMLNETDVEDSDIRKIPLDWRVAVRKAFQSLTFRGYKINNFISFKDETGTRRKNFYVFER